MGRREKITSEERAALLESAEQGNVQALRRLGQNYETGRDGFEKDDAKAWDCYRKGAELGDAQMLYWVGLKTGNHNLVVKAAEQGHTWAQEF